MEPMKAMRTVEGTVLYVRPITRPSLEGKGEASVSIVKIVEAEGEPSALYPVGSVVTVPSRALMNV